VIITLSNGSLSVTTGILHPLYLGFHRIYFLLVSSCLDEIET